MIPGAFFGNMPVAQKVLGKERSKVRWSPAFTLPSNQLIVATILEECP